jgi:hypothetical protein
MSQRSPRRRAVPPLCTGCVSLKTISSGIQNRQFGIPARLNSSSVWSREFPAVVIALAENLREDQTSQHVHGGWEHGEQVKPTRTLCRRISRTSLLILAVHADRTNLCRRTTRVRRRPLGPGCSDLETPA